MRPVLGLKNDPRLPAKSLDAVLVVDAYHEIENRVAMLSSLARALKPQGRIGVVDFKLDGTGPGPSAEERVSPDVVVKDAEKAGLRLIRQEPFLPVPVLPDIRKVADSARPLLLRTCAAPSIGSMRVAWRAGSHVAISATNPSPAVTAT